MSGAGGASCQLCTAHHTQLKDLDLIRSGFLINQFFHDANTYLMTSILENLGNWIQNRDMFLHTLGI